MLGKSKGEREQETRVDERAANSSAVSIISSDMTITGVCETNGQLRIEGRVSGDVSAGAVELAPSGAVEGDVLALGSGNGSKPFVISGSVSGAVRAGRVEVRRGGSVSGGVVANEAVVQGKVRGGVQARTRLALDESAEVEGDVLARRLALKEGGRVNGTIRMGDDIRFDDADHEGAPTA
jgi:cytoskeletal protein CcmA (bactofilin family)